MRTTLDEIRHAASPDSVETVHREFEARRHLLNEHARRVNTIRQPVGLSVNQLIGKLLRLPKVAKSVLRLRSDALAAMTVERADEVKQCILDGAANPTLLLGTDPSPWNNADIKEGRDAQEALDLVRRVTSELWPAFERLLGQVVRELGIRPPATFDEVHALLVLLHDVRTIRERYGEEIFSAQPGEIARVLEPAAGGQITRVWAFLTKPAYRAARNRLRGLRATPASSAILRREALQAEHILQRWRLLGAASATPINVDSDVDLATGFTSLDDATKVLGVMTKARPFGRQATHSGGVMASGAGR